MNSDVQRAKCVTRNRRHGLSGSPTYVVWVNMVQRCTNPANTAFPKYGGRGIRVCDHWLTFENFYADMGERPAGTSIDRIDNARGYEPGNCRWATMRTQQNNRTNNRLLTFNGITCSLQEWSRMLPVSLNTIKMRLKKGWSAEAALITPSAPDKGRFRPR